MKKQLPYIVFLTLFFALSFNSRSEYLSYDEVKADLEGRHYYLFESGFFCGTNSPDKTAILSWKKHVEFSDGFIFVLGSLCEDSPIFQMYESSEFKFSEDLETLIFKKEEYQYFQDIPVLCESGQWCPVEQER